MKKLREGGYLKDDSLRARVDLNIYGQHKSSVSSRSHLSATTEMNSSVNFGLLLEDSVLSDMKIQCGTEVFPVHKAILAGQSAVFKVMFTSEMSEVNSGVINVTDMTPAALRLIIRYMYTGTMEDQLDSALLLEVVYGSEKYGLSNLKNHCFRKLVACITDQNVGPLAVAAHMYGAEKSITMTLKKFIQP